MRSLEKTDRLPLNVMRWAIALVVATLAVAVHAADPEWAKVTTEHFTILTPAGPGVARKWAIELEQFRRGLQAAVPVDVRRLRPVTVVLFKDEASMDAFAPLEKGKPVKIGGFFVRANDVNTIMLSVARKDRETRRVIYHEAVHWHLSAREGFMPLWLAEGLAEVCATFALPDAKTYEFGDVFEEHVDCLREESLLPLPKLVGIGRDSLLYNEGSRTSIFYAQAWAFVHFLFYGETSPGPESVQRYLDLLPRVRSPDDAFLTAFGADYATLEHQLRRYVEGGRYHKRVFSRSTDDIARSLKTGRASLADIELAKGSLLLGSRSSDDAEPFLGRAAQLAPADPRPWELLGNIAVRRRDFTTARIVLTHAAAVGSTSYLVFHNLAVSRLPELSQPWTPHLRIDPHILDLAAADFRKAITMSPSHIPSYEGLAGVMRGMATFVPDDLPLLTRGLAQSPGNTMIEAGIAAAEVRAGRTADGRARLENLCARHPTGSGAGVDFARRLLADEMLQSEIREIKQRSLHREFDEVIAVADRALTRPLDPAARHFMENVKQRAADYQKIRSAVDYTNQGDLPAARAAIDTLLATGPEPAVEREAQEILRDITRLEERESEER